MASVGVRADRALEAAERLLGQLIDNPNRRSEVESIASACQLAMKRSFGDGTGIVTLSGLEAAWLLPHFVEPQEL